MKKGLLVFIVLISHNFVLTMLLYKNNNFSLLKGACLYKGSQNVISRKKYCNEKNKYNYLNNNEDVNNPYFVNNHDFKGDWQLRKIFQFNCEINLIDRDVDGDDSRLDSMQRFFRQEYLNARDEKIEEYNSDSSREYFLIVKYDKKKSRVFPKIEIKIKN